MYEYRDRSISDLSGGQQQRVFVAGAQALEAEILILDEPFAAVDRKTESIVCEIFSELKAQSKTLLVISHDLSNNIRS